MGVGVVQLKRSESFEEYEAKVKNELQVLGGSGDEVTEGECTRAPGAGDMDEGDEDPATVVKKNEKLRSSYRNL